MHKNKSINIWRVFQITAIFSLLIIYFIRWGQMISSPSQRTGSDFMGLYTAARISQSQGFSSIYNIENQQHLQAQIVGFEFHPDQTSYFTHPPFIVPLVRLITDKNYVNSLTRWTVILLLLNGLGVFLLIHSLSPKNFQTRDIVILTAGAFLFWPTFSGLMNGQDSAVLLLGAAAWMLNFLDGKQIAAGLGLCLITIRPQLALMLSVPFLMKYQKVFLGFTIGSIALILVSFGLIGLSGFFDYMNILRVVEGGLSYLPHAKDMPSISGFLRRNFETMDMDFFRITIWSGFLVGLTGLCFWWRKSREITEQHIGLLILLGLIFVPYAHYHELTLLLIPIFCLIRVLSAKKLVSSQTLALLPFAVGLMLMVGFIGSGALKYLMVYIVMILLGYFLLFPEKIKVFAITPRRRLE
jgi:hypothetical protein